MGHLGEWFTDEAGNSELLPQRNTQSLGVSLRGPVVVAMLLLRLFPIAAQAQCDYLVTNQTVTITGYDCSSEAVTISNQIQGLPVVSISGSAFLGCKDLTSITIADTVTNIGDNAFMGCGLTNVTMGRSVASIGIGAFVNCKNLGSITIPASVTEIKYDAFRGCTNLTQIYFQGNAPKVSSSVFYGDNNATVYFLSETTGWDKTFGGCPTAVWTETSSQSPTNSNSHSASSPNHTAK